MSDRPAILLVHGAWHGSWCWSPLKGILEERGWDVLTIDLPTVHASNKVDLNLQSDVDAIMEAVDAIDGDVVVVAHSYGGVPTSQALAGKANVRHIVYVAAFVLDSGESLIGSVGGVAPDWWHIDGPLATAGHDVQTPQSLFYGDLDSALADASAARLQSQSVAAFTDVQTAAAWHDTPSTYVVTEKDAIFPLEAQLGLAARAGSAVARLATSHSPFLAHPEAVANIIEAAATQKSSN